MTPTTWRSSSTQTAADADAKQNEEAKEPNRAYSNVPEAKRAIQGLVESSEAVPIARNIGMSKFSLGEQDELVKALVKKSGRAGHQDAAGRGRPRPFYG